MTHKRADIPRAVRALACLATLVLTGGCALMDADFEDRIYADIRQSRHRAYEAWKRATEGRLGDQPVLAGDLSRDAAVLCALGNNKELGTVIEQVENAKGRVIESYALALPKADLGARYTRLDRAVFGGEDNYSVDLVLTQPIFRGGAINAGIRAARLARYLSDQRVAATAQNVVYRTRLGYHDVLLARELVKVSQDDLGLAQAHLAEVKKKMAAGVDKEYNKLRAEVEVSNVEAELVQRQNRLHLAMTSLLKTLGVSQESRVNLTDKLEYQPIQPERKDAVKQAFSERPEVLEAELNVRVGREALLEAQSGFMPRLEATLAYTHARPDPRDSTNDHWEEAGSAGVGLTWPVFDGLASYGRVRQAEADLRRAVIELADAEEQVLLDVRQALLNLEDAKKFVESQQKNLERAAEGLRLARVGYRAGVTTEIEMRDARQALFETQALYYQAVYGYETAKLGFERATGALKRDPFRRRPQ